MFRLDLEKAEEAEIKLPNPFDHRKSKGNSEKKKKNKNIYCFTEYNKAFDCVNHNEVRKILKEIGIPDYLTCPIRNLYAGQEAIVRIEH